MIQQLESLSNAYYYLKGWKSNKRIVVIESDDWGTVRMPNKKSQQILLKKYPENFNSPYYHLDTLANVDDLTNLFEVLTSVKGNDGNYAKLTANTIVANPDFEKIKSAGFKKYYYELFTETLKSYYSNNPLVLWHEGIAKSVFHPQLHGREHVNVSSWMNLLSNDNKLIKEVFNYNTFAVDCFPDQKKKNLTAAFEISDEEDLGNKVDIIKDACNIFENIFGIKSKSFIAPSYTWDSCIEDELARNGVMYLQGLTNQKCSLLAGKTKITYKRNFLNKRNDNGQTYLIRNVFFEPSLTSNTMTSIIDNALNRIRMMFILKKPVIISSHRLNYVGALDAKNRDKNLKGLKLLLRGILNKWPDTVFLSSDELGELMQDEN